MDAVDRALLESSVREALASAPDPSGTDVDGVLGRLGWLDMLEAEPRAAIDVVFGALGTTNHTATALDDVVVAALGLEPSADLAVLLPRYATWACPGRIAAGELHAVGLTTARITRAAQIVVLCETDSGLQRSVTPAEDANVSAVGGIDPRAGLHLVRIEHLASDVTPVDATAWESAVAAGPRAVAHQISGAPGPCSIRRGRMRSSACSSGDRSPSSRPCGTAWRKRSSRSRHSTRR